MTEIEILDDQSGTTRRTRARLHLADGQKLAVFVKRPSRSLIARAFVAVPRLSRAEVRFYTELRDQVPIATPHCHGADHFWRGFIVVLEDLADSGATLRRSTDTLSADQAASLLASLAAMHRQWWGRTESHPWLARNPRRELKLGALLSPLLCRLGLWRVGSAVPEELHQPIARYARTRRGAQEAMSAGPTTLIHNDCHPGNQFVAADDRPGLIDWQLCRAGPWARDVAYLLATSLDPEMRRSAEKDLLADYLRQLGPVAPDSDEAWLAYRRNVVYAVEAMLVTAAVGVMMPKSTSLALVNRAATAAADLDSFGAL
ncbi:aminoglycoside phosphotransferase family protein [Candidatus Poriferisocius sp.]|uniref:aminoglycoside phosphotransferase family protein n=1 Tax=Candidatus Poriferisocius sp. TaxID=3101276 RepID=UPI003B5AAF23